MKVSDLPTPCDLACNPERACLEMLDLALEMTVRALIAAYPQLASDEILYWCLDRSPASALAKAIVSQAQSLSREINRYAGQLAADLSEAKKEDDDFPF
jgi:hypothetical protein